MLSNENLKPAETFHDPDLDEYRENNF